jgi:hypothetical protein
MIKELTSKALALADQKSEITEQWGKYAHRKAANVAQQKSIWIAAKKEKDLQSIKIAVGAAAAVQFCNKRVIVQKIGNNYQHAGAWYCGKRYCSHCSNRKRRKILNRFSDFFASEKGKTILQDFDLGLFTVTLQHNKTNKRVDPYYKELSRHWNHALKYGAFKEFIAGGFYNTEHTYGKNGHHIHRHALVLIPRKYDLQENYQLIEEDLRKQWKQRTGGSHQIDLRPLGWDERTESCPPREKIRENISHHMMEITKYITKRDEKGVIAWEIVKAIEENNRSKFYGKFGILYKIRELNFTEDKWELLISGEQIKTSNNKKYLEKFVQKHNLENWEIREIVDPDHQEPKEPRELYIGTPYVRRKKSEITIGRSQYLKQKTKIRGIDQITIVRSGTDKEKRWKKDAITYEIKDLIRIEDNKDSFSKFKEMIRDDQYHWKLQKWSDLLSGNTVEQWKANRSGISVTYSKN